MTIINRIDDDAKEDEEGERIAATAYSGDAIGRASA